MKSRQSPVRLRVPFASHSTGLFVAWHHWSAQDLHAHTPLIDAAGPGTDPGPGGRFEFIELVDAAQVELRSLARLLLPATYRRICPEARLAAALPG